MTHPTALYDPTGATQLAAGLLCAAPKKVVQHTHSSPSGSCVAPRSKKRRARAALLGRLTLSAACLVAAGVMSFSIVQASADDAAPAQAAAPAVAVQPGELEVYPASIDLNTNADHQSLVVRTRRADGVTVDLTHSATYRVENAELASVEGNVVHPKQDGETAIIIEHGGKTARVPLTVSEAGADRPISFRLDVMPVFAKAGCNNGSCHGSARGQDGFHLSLFGYDPANDYHNITRQLPGRRINLADTARSLLLTKSTGSVPHTGGQLFTEDHDFYATLERWLDAGAPDDPADVATVTAVEILPLDIVLEGEGAAQQVTVRAHYSDGSDRDITDQAVLMTSNEPSAAIGDDGVITAGSRGEAFVMARFEAYTVGTPVIVIPAGSDVSAAEALFPGAGNNYVDELINDKLRKMRIVPSDVCSDEVFLRRVYIDIAGQLPTPEALDAFLADESPDKRAAVIDQLLERMEFVEIWVMKWAERLQIRSSNQTISQKSAVLYYEWLREQLAAERPMNLIARDLVGSEGGTFASPATNFYQIERDTLKLAENTVQVFVGARMQCAQCHNHPFDRWTMDDYYGFAAFFSQIGRKRGEDPRETVVFNQNRGEINHPVDSRQMPPTYLGGAVAEIERGTDRRVALAQWLTAPENDFFNQNLANFVWEHFMGRGITHPVDDVRVSNPPVNPQLLAALGDRLVETDYDLKQLVRDICNSQAYQRSTQVNPTNADDTTNFSHAHVRRVRAEVLLDCISQVTDTQDKFTGLPRGARAVQIVDGNTSNYFLTTFGRARRDTVCTCEVIMEPNLSQALHLINGDTTNNKIRQGGVVRNMLREESLEPAQVIDRLYRTCVTRPPTRQELDTLLAYVNEAEDTRQALEDVFWALLNSKEFMFNH
ncbi:DUF1549 and DUF1553 domain-containing protein [Phycisphaeraceae bacterium D3-23]